jgi:UPF0271 protein
MAIELSCDLGEGEPPTRTRALLRQVQAANIACAGHAGDLASMTLCLRLCRAFGVRAGAHPGFPSREDKGRGEARLNAGELRVLLLHQIGGLAVVARHEEVPLAHVKLHGTLYHATDHSPDLARAYLETMRDYFPGLIVVARLGGGVHALARRMRLPVCPEAFADRRYRPDGTLVPRGEPGAILRELEDVRGQVIALREQGLAKTLCLHGDEPNSPLLARRIRLWLGGPEASVES